MSEIPLPRPVASSATAKAKARQAFKRFGAAVSTLLPGLLLTLAVTAVAIAAQMVEVHLFGRAWLEALVLAILIGTIVRSRVDAVKPLAPRHQFQRQDAVGSGGDRCSASRSAPGPSCRSARP